MAKYFLNPLLRRNLQKGDGGNVIKKGLPIPQVSDVEQYDGESDVIFYIGENTDTLNKHHFYLRQNAGIVPIWENRTYTLPKYELYLHVTSNTSAIPSGDYYKIPDAAADLIADFNNEITFVTGDTHTGDYPLNYKLRNYFDVVQTGDIMRDSNGELHTITQIVGYNKYQIDGTTTINIRQISSAKTQIVPMVTASGQIIFWGEPQTWGAYDVRAKDGVLYAVSNWDITIEQKLLETSQDVTVKIKVGEKEGFNWLPLEVQKIDLSNYPDPAVFADNVTIKGDLYVEGREIVTDVETVQSEDDFILLRYNNPSALGNNDAGLKFLNYDGEGADLMLVVRGDGILRLGLADSLEPLATRDESAAMEANGVAIWDADAQKLKTATPITNIVKSYELTAQTQITEINSMTQSAYDALTTKNDNKLYVII